MSDILVQDICLTKRGSISATDLRHISMLPKMQWVWNKYDVELQEQEKGTWILKDFKRLGKFVGRVIKIIYPTKNHHPDAAPVYDIKYEDGDTERMSEVQALGCMKAFDTSGFKATTGWQQPSAGIRQLKRLQRAKRRRPSRRVAAAIIAANLPWTF